MDNHTDPVEKTGKPGVKLEVVISIVIVGALSFILGALITSFKSYPTATNTAVKAVEIIIRQEYQGLADDVLLSIVQDQGLCDLPPAESQSIQ